MRQRGHRVATALPWWLNWTTVRGAALIGAGLTVMVGPREEALLVSLFGILFVGWAAGEVWFVFLRRNRPTGDGAVLDSGTAAHGLPPVSRIAMGLVLVVAAVLLFMDDLPFSVVVGGVLVARGILVAAYVLGPAGAGARRDGLLRVLMLLIVGTTVILVPDTAILALRAGLGVGSIALGGIVVSMGLRRTGEGGDAQAKAIHFDHHTAPALLNDWLMRRRMAPQGRAELVETLFFEPPNKTAKLASFWVMMVLATGIASFAVIQDSTAVVIGAMLVAPLMTPIMGVSAAAVNGWPQRLFRSLVLVVVAALAAVALAWLIASWLPSVGNLSTNSQITSRVEPSLLDFCIAVFAGSAGAYATVDPRVSSSLSGVAIAVALVPPLSVVGITLEQGDLVSAEGAMLLFCTNVVSIVLAAVTVFVLMGFAALPPDQDQRTHLRRVIGVFGVGALVILLPLSFTSEDLWTEAADEGATRSVLDDWLSEDDKVHYQDVAVEDHQVEITLAGPAVPDNTDELVTALTDRLGYHPEVTIRLIPSTITELD
jgi:uncharacterized hydrophobic protein (TIGR00271 family)